MDILSRKARKNIDYTIMSNRTFEALFCAENRDNEIQFRLLYTPLAQQETVKLLQDKTVGYGDDFIFHKNKKNNMIIAAHLQDFDITASPDIFRHFDLERIRDVFRKYNEGFFKAFYFAMAPLLAIPLYQQPPPYTHRFGTAYGKKRNRLHSGSVNLLRTVSPLMRSAIRIPLPKIF